VTETRLGSLVFLIAMFALLYDAQEHGFRARQLLHLALAAAGLALWWARAGG